MVYDFVESFCKSKGIRINAFEKQCGFSNGYIAKLKTSTPSATKLKKIADAIGIPIEYLLKEE